MCKIWEVTNFFLGKLNWEVLLFSTYNLWTGCQPRKPIRYIVTAEEWRSTVVSERRGIVWKVYIAQHKSMKQKLSHRMTGPSLVLEQVWSPHPIFIPHGLDMFSVNKSFQFTANSTVIDPLLAPYLFGLTVVSCYTWEDVEVNWQASRCKVNNMQGPLQRQKRGWILTLNHKGPP